MRILLVIGALLLAGTASIVRAQSASDRGKSVWGKQAKKAVANLQADKELTAKIEAVGGNSSILTPLALKRLVAIESRCDRKLAYSKNAYRGFLQMGDDACKDVGVDFSTIKNPASWRAGIDAGVKYLEKNHQRLKDDGYTPDVSKPTSLLHFYLYHQQGPNGGKRLLDNVKSGKAKTTQAPKRMRVQVAKSALTAFDADGTNMTEYEFYEYFLGAMNAVCEAIK